MGIRIVLYDLVSSGHHLNYAGYMCDLLTQQGDSVLFVGGEIDPAVEVFLHARPYVESYSVRTTKLPTARLPRLLAQYRAYRKAFQVADSWNADVVHLLYVDGSELPLWASYRRWRSWRLFGTLFWTHFATVPGETPSLGSRIYRWFQARALGRLVRRGLDGLFVQTDGLRDTVVHHTNIAASTSANKKLYVVPDPAPVIEKRPSRQDAAKRLDVPLDLPIVLLFGSLRTDKGPDILLQALPHVKTPCTVLIAGQPSGIPENAITQTTAAVSGTVRVVSHLGYLAEDSVADYFAVCDLVVLPYKRAFKGTSGVLQQAAAAGKPVIASDVGAVGLSVRKHGLGRTVLPEDPTALAQAIDQAIADWELLSSSVQESAREYAHSHSAKALVSAVREVYASESLR